GSFRCRHHADAAADRDLLFDEVPGPAGRPARQVPGNGQTGETRGFPRVRAVTRELATLLARYPAERYPLPRHRLRPVSGRFPGEPPGPFPPLRFPVTLLPHVV